MHQLFISAVYIISEWKETCAKSKHIGQLINYSGGGLGTKNRNQAQNSGHKCHQYKIQLYTLFIIVGDVDFFFHQNIFFQNIGPGAFLFLLCVFVFLVEQDETSIVVHSLSNLFSYAECSCCVWIFPIIAAVFYSIPNHARYIVFAVGAEFGLL